MGSELAQLCLRSPRLESLGIGRSKCELGSLASLGPSSFPSLTSLDLTDLPWMDPLVSFVLSTAHTLTSLCLASRSAHREEGGLDAIVRECGRHPSLTLDLSTANVITTSSVVEGLLSTLQTGAPPPSLVLSRLLDDSRTHRLLQALRNAPLDSLSALSLLSSFSPEHLPQPLSMDLDPSHAAACLSSNPSARASVLLGLCELLASAPSLTSLSLPGEPNTSLAMGPSLHAFFLAGLKANTTLTFLDVSHNSFGEVGALALGSALRTNRALRALRIDGNGITTEGLK